MILLDSWIVVMQVLDFSGFQVCAGQELRGIVGENAEGLLVLFFGLVMCFVW